MATAERTTGAGRTAPVRAITVLHDPDCPLCAALGSWLMKQRQLVPLDLVAAGSPEARRRFPRLDHDATLAEITVVGDGGQVYRGSAAWVVTLWALAEYRPLAHRFSTPAGAHLARGAVLAAAKYRSAGRRPEGWGGQTYRRADGWSYNRTHGWSYDPPGCDSACRTGD